MRKICTTIMAMLLLGVLLTGMAAAVYAAPEDAGATDTPPATATATDELPTVTAPPATEAPEVPMLTAMPDAPGDTAPDVAETPSDEDGGAPDLGVVTVPVLVIICFGIGQCIKPSKLDNEWIPTIMVPTGGILGVIAYHVMPDFPAGDPVTAVGIGVASGLAATGIHQAVKQAKMAAAKRAESSQGA